MGKTRYDYLDILYLYLMSLGQILRAIEIQWVLTFHPSMKTSVWQQLNIYGFISRTIRQKIAHQCLRYVKYRSMVIFLSIVTQFKNNINFFLIYIIHKISRIKIHLFQPGCNVGYYGENCSKSCGVCKSGTCDIVTGQCDELGCALPGLQASACIGSL